MFELQSKKSNAILFLGHLAYSRVSYDGMASNIVGRSKLELPEQ